MTRITSKTILEALIWRNSDGESGGGGASSAAPSIEAVTHTDASPGLDSASSDARAALAAGMSLEQYAANKEATHHAARQPRTPEGQFDGAPAPAPPVDGQVADPNAPPVDPNAPPAEAAQTDDTALENKGIEIPGLAEGEEPIVLEIEDEAAAARINALLETRDQLQQYVAREQQVEKSVEQIEQVRDMIEVDPGGYLLNLMPNDPQTVTHVAEFLLTRPEIWAALKDKVATWTEDPTQFELAAARALNERMTMRDDLVTAQQERREVTQNYQAINTTIVAMAGEMDAETRAQFHRDALMDIKYHADRVGARTIDPADLPVILAGRLRAYKVDPVAAAARAANPQAAPSPKKAVAKAVKPAVQQPTGQQFVAGQQARERFARVPSGGGGSPSNTIEVPKGMSIEQTTKWHRDQLAAGRKVLT